MLWTHIWRSRHYTVSKEGNQNSWQSWKTDACFLLAGKVFHVQNELQHRSGPAGSRAQLSDFVFNLCQIKYHQNQVRWSITIGRKLFYFCCLKSGPLQYCKVQAVQKSSTVPGALKAASGQIDIWRSQDNVQNSEQPKHQCFLKKKTKPKNQQNCFNLFFKFWQKISKEVTMLCSCYGRKEYDE